MKLDKVMSISGKPGLYELKAQTRGGFIVESMLDGKKITVSMRHNVSLLSEIAIYTYTEEVPLSVVFQKIKEKEDSKETISHKESKAALEQFFREILPEYDEDRVYPSDIKKIVQWYNLLVSKGITDFSESEESAEDQKESAGTPEKNKEEEE